MKRDLIRGTLTAVLVVGAPIAIALLRDECDDTHDHEFHADALDELRAFADGELARGRRMEILARDIRAARDFDGYELALDAERRR